MLLEKIEDLRQAGVLVHRHHAVRKNPYPELRNGIVEKTPLLPKRRDEELDRQQAAARIIVRVKLGVRQPKRETEDEVRGETPQNVRRGKVWNEMQQLVTARICGLEYKRNSPSCNAGAYIPLISRRAR